MIWRLPLLFLLGASLAMAGPRPFGPHSFEEIRARHAGAPALLMLWSVECAYCKADMARAVEQLEAHPGLALVLINVDAVGMADAVHAAILETGTVAAEHWQFGDHPGGWLRAAIDPHWYGELPRTYLLSADGSLRGTSGRLPPAVFEHWVETSRAVRGAGDGT